VTDLKILQIYPISMKASGGGVGEHVKNISINLAKNHDVTLFGLNPRNRYSRYEEIEGVKVFRFKHYYPMNSYYFSIELPLSLLKVKFDVVHGHSYHAFPMHYSNLANSKKKIITTHFHGEGHTAFRNILFQIFNYVGYMTLKKVDHIIAVSDYEKKLINSMFHLGYKTIVIPNGLNLSEFKNLKPKKSDYKKILYVGRLEAYKGIQYVLKALRYLDEEYLLEIVGWGAIEGYLKNIVEKYNLQSRVLFYKDVSRSNLLQKFADASVFVLLSKHEAYSMVVAEALAARTPCVLANTSALVEWIDEKSCFKIEYPINELELAKKIEFAADKKRGVNIKNWKGKKILDWRDVTKKLERVYEYE